jgi:hypothetical protein
MNAEKRDRAVENAVVNRRPGSWRGVLLCLALAVLAAVLAVVSTGTRPIGIALVIFGLLSALAGALHLALHRGA